MATIQECALPEVRAVHNLERYSVARTNSDVFYNVIVGPRLRAVGDHFHPTTADQAEWAQFLARPLTWLITEHSSLSVVVRDHLSNKPWFVRMPSVDLSKVVSVMTVPTPESVDRILEVEHNKKYDLSDWSVPMWRIIVVRVESDGSFFLLYNFHHAIGDGRSGMALTEQLHEQVNLAVRNPSKERVPIIVPSPKEKDMPLPMELRANCNPRPTTILKAIIHQFLVPKPIKNVMSTKYWAGEKDAVSSPHIAQLGFFKLDKEETSLVLKAAKKHNNTVQSMLYAASVFAAQSCFIYPRQLKGEEVDPAQRFSTPVALRPLLPDKIGRNVQGSFTSELVHTVVVKPESSFWQCAQVYRQSVIQGTQTEAGVKELLEHFGLLKYVPNHPGGWEEFLKGQIKEKRHGRNSTIMVSNLGQGWNVCPIPLEEQAYVIEDAVFGQSAEVIGSAFGFSVATANGILTATNVWQETAFHGRELGEWYTRETRRILLEASRPDRTDVTLQEVYVAREPCPN